MILKQAFIVNSDLNMGKGKIAVQVGHGEVLYMDDIIYEYCKEGVPTAMFSRYQLWRDETNGPIGTMRKIVLRSSEEEIINMADNLTRNSIKCYLIFDKGLTQVKPNSLTVLAVEPLEEEKYDELFGHLKLL